MYTEALTKLANADIDYRNMSTEKVAAEIKTIGDMSVKLMQEARKLASEADYNEQTLKDRYKKAEDVIRMLVDVVSKNGNLLLNIPVRGNGTIDPVEESIVCNIGKWMRVNGESIYGTRPWRVYGEGPSTEQNNPIAAQGFNEGKVKMTARDIRYNQKGKWLYATLLGVPTDNIVMRNLAKHAPNVKGIRKIELLGSDEKVVWHQASDALHIDMPLSSPFKEAIVYKIYLK